MWRGPPGRGGAEGARAAVPEAHGSGDLLPAAADGPAAGRAAGPAAGRAAGPAAGRAAGRPRQEHICQDPRSQDPRSQDPRGEDPRSQDPLSLPELQLGRREEEGGSPSQPAWALLLPNRYVFQSPSLTLTLNLSLTLGLGLGLASGGSVTEPRLTAEQRTAC